VWVRGVRWCVKCLLATECSHTHTWALKGAIVWGSRKKHLKRR